MTLDAARRLLSAEHAAHVPMIDRLLRALRALAGHPQDATACAESGATATELSRAFADHLDCEATRVRPAEGDRLALAELRARRRQPGWRTETH